MAIQTGASAPANRRKLLPPGRYLTQCETVELTLARTGTQRLSFAFRIVGGGENQGKKIYDDFYLTEGAMWRLNDFAMALGIPQGTEINEEDPASLMNLFSGKSVWINMAEDDYTNKDGVKVETRKITRYDSTDTAIRAKMDEARRARLDGIPASSAPSEADSEVPF